MKPILLSLILVLISGCSNNYSDIEVVFGSKEKPAESKQIDTKTFSVSSQNHKGIETFRNIATILVSEKGIFLDAGAPFTESVFIPTMEIVGCAMTCFGTEDQHVDFIIPKTGTDLMIQSSKDLINWCWENKKPMFSGKTKRGWLYNKVSLPPANEFEEQLSDRKKYDEQKRQSCLGY